MKYPTIDTEATGRNIKRLIKNNGLSVKDVAEELHVTLSAVYCWCWGEKMPSIDNLVALSVLLKTPLDKILRVQIR